MAKRDLDFKLFLVHHADELITAETGIQVEEWQSGETEPQPLPRERRLDRVFRSTGSNARLYVHFEVQNDPDRTMAHRMHEYGVRLMYSSKNPAEWWPVLSVALWPRRVPHIPEAPLRIPVAERMEIVWPFVNITIFTWTKSKLASDLPGVLILAPLVPEVTLADLEMYAQRLYTVTAGDDREAAGVLFLTFVEERYRHEPEWAQIRAQVAQMLQKVGFGMDVIDEMILNTLPVQNAVEAAEQRGIELGEQRGIALGEVQGEIKLVRTLWKKKFGPLTADEAAALEHASADVLEHMAAQMVELAYTLEQARMQLGL